MDKQQIKEMLQFSDLTEEEKAKRGILGRLYGPCASIVDATRNGRRYSDELWRKVFTENEIVKEMFQNGGIPLELDHPVDREETDSTKIAAMLPAPPQEDRDGHLMCYVDIIDTPCGKIAYQLAKYGFKLGISSRGTGDLYQNSDGTEDVDPDTYDFTTFDLVLLPAVKDARLAMTESFNTKKAKLKAALTESYNQSSKEDRRIMAEAMNDLKLKEFLDDTDKYEEDEDFELSESGDKDLSEGVFDKVKSRLNGITTDIKEVTTRLKQLEKQLSSQVYYCSSKHSKINMHSLGSDGKVEKVLSAVFMEKDIAQHVKDEIDKLGKGVTTKLVKLYAPFGGYPGEKKQDKDDDEYYAVLCIVDKQDEEKNESVKTRTFEAKGNTTTVDDDDEKIAEESVEEEPEDEDEDKKKDKKKKSKKDKKDKADKEEAAEESDEIEVEFDDEADEAEDAEDTDNDTIEDLTVKDFIKELKDYDNKLLVDVAPLNIEGKEYKLDNLSLEETDDKLVLNFDYIPTEENPAEEDNINNEVAPEFETEVPTDVEPIDASVAPVAVDDGMAELMDSLKKTIRDKKALEEEVKALKTERAVGDTKVQELTEQVEKYKTSFERVSKIAASAKKFEKENVALKEDLAKKEDLINKAVTLTESAKTNAASDKARIKELTESLAKANKQVEIQNAALTKQATEFQAKLEERAAVAKKYSTMARQVVEHYIEQRAKMLGVHSSEITRRLNEHYTLNDIDAACDAIMESGARMSTLPFNSASRVRVTESVDRSAKVVKKSVDDGYDIDNSLLELAGLI